MPISGGQDAGVGFKLFRRAAFGVLGYTVLGFRASQFLGFSLWRKEILGFWQGEACCGGSHILLALAAMQQLYLWITTGSGLGVAVLEVVNLGGGGGGRSGNPSGGGWDCFAAPSVLVFLFAWRSLLLC